MSFPKYPKYKDSGVEWLGEVPEHWEVIKTKRLFKLVAEPAPDQNNYELLSIYTDIGVRPRKELEAKGNKATTTDGYWRVKKGDLIVNKLLAWMGAIGISEYDGVTSPAYDILRQICPLEPHFFDYLFRCGVCFTEFKRFSRGIMDMRLRLYFEEFGQMNMPFPPLFEQKQIVSFLNHETSKIDALVDEQRRLIELLKEKRQAVISHAVTKGLNPNAPMKPSGIEWLGDVPEHWEVIAIRKIASVVRGASPRPAGDPRFFNGFDVPWVTVAEITKDECIELSETDSYLTKEGSQHSKLFKSGTLIYSNSGATLGVPKILSLDACANDGVVAFENLSPSVSPRFLYHYLESITDAIREKVKQGSGQPNLNTDIVKSLRFALPPIVEQEIIIGRISELAEQYASLQLQSQRAIDLLLERRTALISAAVTGKIDVRMYPYRTEPD